MASEITNLEYSCLICGALVSTVDPPHTNQLLSSSVNQKKSLHLFLLKVLLEISETVIFVQEQLDEKDNKHKHWHWLINNNWKHLQTCENCEETIKQASLIYNEIKGLTLKFRGIQKKILDTFKKCSVKARASEYDDDKQLNNFVKQCRGIVESYDFNGFAFPFTVKQDDDDDKEDWNTSESFDFQATVKIEDEDQVSRMDSEEDLPHDIEEALPHDLEEDNYFDESCSLATMDPKEEGRAEHVPVITSFICKTCLHRFPTKRQLDNHHKTVHLKDDKGPFPCPIKGCCKVYKKSAILTRHLRKDHREPPFFCKDCEEEFLEPEQVLIHQKECLKLKPKKASRSNPFPCPFCDLTLKSYGVLKSHLKKIHPSNPVNLKEIKLKFLQPSSDKLTESHKIAKFKKHVLGISTFEQQYPHILIARNSEGNFPCPWTEDPSPTSTTTTPTCQKVFKTKGYLEQHIQLKHLNLPLYKCSWTTKQGDICGVEFSTQANYQWHLDEHKGTPKFKCDQCDLTFYRRNPFKRHQEKMHSGGRFICEICGRGYACQEYLTLHRGSKHKEKADHHLATGNEKDVPGIICDFCGMTFKSKYNLRAHVEVKHENVPGKHCCHLCDKRFRVSTHLKIHLWRGHRVKADGFEPKEMAKWQCGVVGCKMLFLNEENFERHRKEVHGEDGKKQGQWKCKYCEKEYFVRVKWEHCEKLHENKESRPEKCGVCGKGFPTRKYLQYHEKYVHNKDKHSREYKRKINKK